jgi:hypothetical protein
MNDGSWLLYPWFEEHGASLVYPDDMEAFRKLSPYGKVFQRIGDDGNWAVIVYAGARIRVDATCAKVVNAPAFGFGQRVLVRRHRRVATVVEIRWHYKADCPFFFVEAGGRRVKTRYWPDDLEPAESA